MILKKDTDPKLIVSYRPISITPCLARLFEKLLLSRLQKHLDNNKIIVTQQSGFLKNRSTQDNLVMFTQKIREGFADKKMGIGVFFDIQAAFDRVWHSGLIFKLIKIKTPYYIIRLLIDFLESRTFNVKIGNIVSLTRKITAGVPQGAVSSSSLFAVYINDSPQRNGSSLKCKLQEHTCLFANDLGLLAIFDTKNQEEARIAVQLYLNELET